MVHQRSSENNKHDQSKFQASEGVHAKSCIQASIPPSPAELYPRADKGLAQGHTKVAQLVEPRSSKTEGLILPAGQEFLSCFLSLDCRVLPSLTWSGQCPAAFFFQRTRASPPMDSVFGRPGGRPGPRGTRSKSEFLTLPEYTVGFPGGASGKEPACQCRSVPDRLEPVE